ncbi:MAG TPA: DUF4198 domain-containing protein [Gemmata sp.]
MFRAALAAVAALGALTAAQAHFIFVVPDPQDPSKAVVVFSEDLEPDENVTADRIAGLKLTCRNGAGKDAAVSHKAGKHELTATLPGTGPRVVFGSLNYGVMQKGLGKPYLLAYHPKALVGAVPADQLVLGAKVLPVELVPVIKGDEVRFQFLSGGKPVAGAAVTVIKTEGGKKALTTTDKDGLTEAFPAKGRYGLWTKDVVAKPGALGDKKYDEARHYATLVMEFPAK